MLARNVSLTTCRVLAFVQSTPVCTVCYRLRRGWPQNGQYWFTTPISWRMTVETLTKTLDQMVDWQTVGPVTPSNNVRCGRRMCKFWKVCSCSNIKIMFVLRVQIFFFGLRCFLRIQTRRNENKSIEIVSGGRFSEDTVMIEFSLIYKSI